MFEVLYLPEVGEHIKDLNPKDHARLSRVRELFEERGFIVGKKYIKKDYKRQSVGVKSR